MSDPNEQDPQVSKTMKVDATEPSGGSQPRPKPAGAGRMESLEDVLKRATKQMRVAKELLEEEDEQTSRTAREGEVSQTGKTAGEVSQTAATAGGGAGGGKHDLQALIGKTIDRYKIIKLLGEGGFGAVYKAEHTLMKRDVAFKTLHAELAKDPAILYRFKKEAQVAARFRHKNAIELYDFGQMADGAYFMAMEFLPGKDVRDHLKKEGALDLPLGFDVLIQTLWALQAAHDGGVIHRDLKPDNIKLENREGRDNFVKVLDFGIAKIKDPKPTDEIVKEWDNQSGKMNAGDAQQIIGSIGQVKQEDVDTSYKTQIGAFFGTPEYGSPEQCAGDDIDGRSDLYTMGVIMYELLTGQLPFISKTPQGYLAQHMVAPPRPISEVRPDLKLPPEVEAIMMKAMEKRPEDRFQTCEEFAHALVETAHGLKIPITVVEAKAEVWTKKQIAGIASAIVLPLVLGFVIYVKYFTQDEVFVGAQTAFADYVRKGDYDGAENFLKERAQDPHFVDNNYLPWVNSELAAVKKKVEARDRRIDGELKKITGEVDPKVGEEDDFLAKAATDKEGALDLRQVPGPDYDRYLDDLTDLLTKDPEVTGDREVKALVAALHARIKGKRDQVAAAFWQVYEARIDRHIARIEYREAEELCRGFPDRYKLANDKAQAGYVTSKLAQVQLAEKNLSAKIREAKEALVRAERYRTANPKEWSKQLDEFQKVVTSYGDTPPGAIAKADVIPKIAKEWRDNGKAAYDALWKEIDALPIKAAIAVDLSIDEKAEADKGANPEPKAVDEAKAARAERFKRWDEQITSAFDTNAKAEGGLDKAFRDHAAFPPIFQDDRSAGPEWKGLYNWLVARATERMNEAKAVAAALRDRHMPERSVALLETWTQLAWHQNAFVKAAEAELRILRYVAALHGDPAKQDRMALVPAALADIGEEHRKGQYGEPVHLASSPIHKAWVHAFWIDRYEVTNREYKVFLDEAAATRYKDKPDEVLKRVPLGWRGDKDAAGRPAYRPEEEFHPVRGVTQEHAAEFAKWLGKRLPTEFEWEYAARGPSAFLDAGRTKQRLYPWPPLFDEGGWAGYGQVNINPAVATGLLTAKVGSYKDARSFPFALYDMNGNVLEWTSSAYLRYPGNDFRDQFNPTRIVARGGAYDARSDYHAVKATQRYWFPVGSRPQDVGFRCAKDAWPEVAQ